MKLRLVQLLPVCFVLASLCAHGQSAVNHIEKFTVEDGLSSQEVKDIAQDYRGFLWIATSNGLNRYDGTEVVKYMADGTGQTLPDNGVTCLLPTPSGRLIIGTDQGIAILDLQANTFRTVHLAPKDPQKPFADQVQHLICDHWGQYWASTPSAIYRMDSNLVVQDVFVTQGKPMGSRFMNVLRMIPLPSRMVLFWTSNGTFSWSPGSKGLALVQPGRSGVSNFIYGSSYSSIDEVANKYLIRLQGSEISVYNLTTNELSLFPLPKPMEPVMICNTWGNKFAVSSKESGGAIYTLDPNGPGLVLEKETPDVKTEYYPPKVLEDDRGNLWLMNELHELFKVPKEKQLFHHVDLFTNGKGDLSTNEIIDLLPCGKSVLVGSYGDGYFKVDPSTGEQQHYSVRSDSFSGAMVWHFRLFGNDTLWIATQQGIVCHFISHHRWGRLPMAHPALLDSVAITTLFTDSRGWVWMGLGKGNGVAIYDPGRRTFRLFPFDTGEYPYRYPVGAGEDAEGNMWFISDVTGDLVQWKPSTGRFRQVLVPGVNGAIHYETGGFFLDKQLDEIWYGVQPVGLVQYRIRQGTSRVYNTKNGLTTGMIHGITMDGSRRLWLGTDQGISRFDPATESAINYTRSDGLPGNRYTSRLVYDTTLDRIYAGSPGALTWFTPPVKLVNDGPMPIYMTDLTVNGHSEKYRPGDVLELGPDQNNLYVKFSAINLSNGNMNRYQYQVNESGWTDLGKQSEIRLASLHPGTYTLQVRAAHKQGAYEPSVTLLHASIQPHFTDTLYFYLICLAGAVSLIFGWYRYRLAQLRRMGAMRARISRDLHDEIGSRLTNINMMSQIIRQDPAHAQDGMLLGKIQEESEEISRSMREIIWGIDPENDHLDAALPRMLSFASQLLEAKNIEVKAEIDDLHELKLDMAMRRDLFLIFKEAVHNVVKHAGATKAVIRVSGHSGQMLLQVEDDGRGIVLQPNGHTGGLRYMHQRAESHGWTLQVNDAGPGTRVSLHIRA